MSSSGAITGDVAPLKYPAPGEAWAIDVKLFSLGVVTARDEWVYDRDPNKIEEKVLYICIIYKSQIRNIHKNTNENFKWTRHLKHILDKGVSL
jgi:predicted helicase